MVVIGGFRNNCSNIFYRNMLKIFGTNLRKIPVTLSVSGTIASLIFQHLLKSDSTAGFFSERFLNPFQLDAAFHIETSHLFCSPIG